MNDYAAACFDLDRALIDPSSAFDRPEDVLRDNRLQDEQKVAILCRWAYDSTELAVAEEEGMLGSDATDLRRVIETLHSILPAYDTEHTPPTKHHTFCARGSSAQRATTTPSTSAAADR